MLVVLQAGSALAAGAGYQDKSLADLSEPIVSRQGAAALAAPGVVWEHGESASFIYHFEQGFLRSQFADQAERFYAGLKQTLGITNDSFQTKPHLFVFLGTNSWSAFLGGGKVDRWSGGFWTGRELFLRARANPKLQSEVLAHELAHVGIQRFVGANLPLWLNEGFAQFEGKRLLNAYQRALFVAKGYRVPPPLAAWPPRRYLPLAALTGAVDYPDDPEQAVDFYKEAELLVTFLHDRYGGKELLVRLLRRQNAGLRFPAALAEVYRIGPADFDRFEEAFRAYATAPVGSGRATGAAAP